MLKSPVTFAIGIICTLVFIVELMCGGDVWRNASEILLNLGGSTGPLTIGQSQYARLISCIFLHASALHLILNVYVLIDFGPMAERCLGRMFYFSVFLFSGVVGALTSIMYNPTQTSVGASAAVLGLLGALIYKSWFEKEGERFTRPQIVMLCIFLLYSLLLGFTCDFVDNAAHLGGFFSGMLACAVYFGTKSGNEVSPVRTFIAWSLLVALIPVLVIVDRQRVVNNPEVAVFKLRSEARSFLTKKDYAQAALKLDEAEKLCGNKVTAVLTERSLALTLLDRQNEALADIDRWLSENKSDSVALDSKAQIQHKLGQDKEAIATITQAIEMKPASLNEAIKDAFSGHGRKGLYYNNRAWYELSVGQIKEGLADVDKSIELDAHNDNSYDTRGMAFYLSKDFGQAEKDFTRAINLFKAKAKNKSGATECGACYYHRALARAALGDTKGSLEDMERSKSLDYKPEAWEPKP